MEQNIKALQAALIRKNDLISDLVYLLDNPEKAETSFGKQRLLWAQDEIRDVRKEIWEQQ